MARLIQKTSSVPGRKPGIADLSLGEIAINTHDGKMFIKQDQNGSLTIQQVGDDPTENVYYVSKSGRAGNKGTSLSDAFQTLDSAFSLITAIKEFTFDEAVCRRDLGYILDGLYLDIAFGTNYNAVTSGLSYQRGSAAKVRDEQISATRSSLNEAKVAVGAVPEVRSSTGFDGALQRTNRHFSEIIDILVNGEPSRITAADDVSYPVPNILYSANADHVAQIIQQNDAYLKNEVTAYINQNYPTLGGFNAEKCIRDVGLILDGFRRDILVGGNYNSITAGQAYLRANSAYVLTEQDSATLVGLNYAVQSVKDLSGVISDATIDTLYSEISGRINGTITTYTTPTFTTTTNGPQGLTYQTGDRVTAADALQTNRQTIIDDLITYINTNFTDIAGYDSARCARDTGFILDALTHDIKYGGNIGARTNAIAYFVGTANQLGTDSDEIQRTIQSYEQLKVITDTYVTTAPEQARVDTLLDIIIDVVTADSAGSVASEEEIVLQGWNTSEFATIDSATDLIARNAGVISATQNVWDSGYNVATCRRDVGYITDALTFDALYGGTHATTINARSYYNGLTDSAILPASQKQASINTYTHLGVIIGELIENNLTSNLTDISLNTSGDGGQYGTAGEASLLQANVAIITDAIAADSSGSIPTRVAPNLVSRGVTQDLRDAINSTEEIRGLIITQSVERGNTTNDIVVYLKSGDYTINNPIKMPPKTAIVGDNLRTVTIRPKNVDSDVFYMDNGTFIKDVTFKDHQNFAACVSYDPKVDSPGAGPFIVQSPYVQNCTSITTDGVGMRIDGDKCSGLKSMVSDAFTQFNAGGYGVYLLNRGYAQLVSIFTISTATSIRAETGGQCSVANSNASFGDFGLIATGSSPVLYQGQLDSEYPIFTDVIRVNNIINLDSYSYLSDFGDYKKPNYNDAMKFDSEEYYYTVLGIDSVSPGVYDITFQPPLNNQLYAGGQNVSFHQRSQITTSSHTFEYVGSGTNMFTAIPQNGGIPVQQNEVQYDSATNEGIVVFTSTDQLGDFKIGSELNINRQAGRIEGETFERSLFAILTPYILALEG